MGVPVIIDLLRSPFSRSRPNQPERDVYNSLRMDDALSRIIPEIIKRNGVNPEDIDDLMTGCTLQMRENFMLGGRTIGMLAEMPVNVPCQATDRVCIGGMSCIHQGSMEILLDYSDVIVASGMEHMTHVSLDPRYNPDLMSFNPRFFTEEKYKKYDVGTAISMGLTAEKLFGMTDFTREDMDLFAYNSHQRAAKALADGYFKDEILPFEVTLEDGTKQLIESDVSIRPDTTLESLAELKPAFNPEG
ncbi:MAG: acetyl-CoA C-acyltransferase, partial [Actinobacteria bacterium]|nr:acetyl-CoA C-acyltransferase [Actinomycetota bacterium]